MSFPGRSYFHGTKAELKIGDLIQAGFQSNFGDRKAGHVYMSGALNAAIWGAELAAGEGEGNIYVVEAIGVVEDDPNLTDKKFPGNPTMSYRSKEALRIIGKVVNWVGHDKTEVDAMKKRIAEMKAAGLDKVDD